MRQRCLNPNNKDYHRYGGRGICIDSRWNSFDIFMSDMGQRPEGDFSIDRIDTNGNYEPSNCHWATREQQNRNRRIRYNTKSGLSGVTEIHTNYWRVRLAQIALGCYDNIFDAACARKSAENKLWKHT
jgi:hypothetical protein